MVEKACLIWSRPIRFFMECAANLGSLSDMILSGSPNRVKILSINIFAMSLEVAFSEVGVKITPFVRPWSTTDSMASKPEGGGRLVMRSQEIWAKGRREEEGSIGINGG